ncbi:MAG TPA: alpha/beta hydrolase, partial [Gammaproteobacteria bacterium]|nr:alpha/beta hydrolase [Gammaproteobacteria bacterium]
CKGLEPIDDQLFEANGQQIQASGHGRCLAVEALVPGQPLHMRECSDSRLQRWRFAAGRLSPAARPELCVALASARGEPWGTPRLVSPAYRRQAIALDKCAAEASTRQAFRWLAPNEVASSRADDARAGMPPELATALAAFGHEFDGAIAQQTAALYAPQPRVYAQEEITVTKDLAYGPHERQHVDVYTRARRPAEPVPAIVVFHGGGLIGGNRGATANVAEYFASLGYVGVNGGYRLAPEAKWPEGARDVAGAVTYLRDHVAEYGGDPSRIFVAGISTGALHAATYVFRPELLQAGAARAAGAILVSGPYTFDFDAAGRGELAYFGEDRARWPEMVVTGNITRTDIPVLMTTAEWDNARYTKAYAVLFHELVVEHGVVPRYFQSLGHNHSSQLLSVGTTDRSVSATIVDFIERTAHSR